MAHLQLQLDTSIAIHAPSSQLQKTMLASNADRTDSILRGDYIAILKGYSHILTLKEMQEKVSHTHQVDFYRERRISCCFVCVGCIIFTALFPVYMALLIQFNFSFTDERAVFLEVCCVLLVLVMAMCVFRWCSLNDISAKTIWQRVAVTQATPLRFIKFDMQNVNISFMEYSIDYGDYPNKLHDPVITLAKQEQICNARDLVKITKKDPNPDEAYSYGAIYFHYKGGDEYYLERWKYDFDKYHRKLAMVYKKCSKFHSVFYQHFGYRLRKSIITDHRATITRLSSIGGAGDGVDDEQTTVAVHIDKEEKKLKYFDFDDEDDDEDEKYREERVFTFEEDDDDDDEDDEEKNGNEMAGHQRRPYIPTKTQTYRTYQQRLKQKQREEDADLYYNTHEMDDSSDDDEQSPYAYIAPELLGKQTRSTMKMHNKQGKLMYNAIALTHVQPAAL